MFENWILPLLCCLWAKRTVILIVFDVTFTLSCRQTLYIKVSYIFRQLFPICYLCVAALKFRLLCKCFRGFFSLLVLRIFNFIFFSKLLIPTTGKYTLLASTCFMILPILSHQIQNDVLRVAGAVRPSSPAEKPDPSASAAMLHGFPKYCSERKCGKGLACLPMGSSLRRGAAGCAAESFPFPEPVASLSRDGKSISTGDFCHPAARMKQGSLFVASLGCVAPKWRPKGRSH